MIGGVGLGDRVFPPASGLTFSTWICVDKFSDPRSDPHPVRILTLARSTKASPETSAVCLAIAISTRDKAIIVSCQVLEGLVGNFYTLMSLLIPSSYDPLFQESSTDQNNDWQPEFSGDWGARVWFPDIMKEGEWHHLTFTFSKQVSLELNVDDILYLYQNYDNRLSRTPPSPYILMVSKLPATRYTIFNKIQVMFDFL